MNTTESDLLYAINENAKKILDGLKIFAYLAGTQTVLLFVIAWKMWHP